MSLSKLIIKWSKRRRNLGLVVDHQGHLVILAPQGTTPEAIGQALAKHQAWIAKKQGERRQSLDRLKPGQVYLLGLAYNLHIRAGPAAKVVLRNGAILVGLPETTGGFWPVLRQWYLRQAEYHLPVRVEHFQNLMHLIAGPVQVWEWQRRWGECRPGEGGRLRFNWRLILLPPEILDYVVVHELAHLKVAGHPPGFWQQVEAILPDYRRRRGWLNNYGLPFLRWTAEVPGNQERIDKL
jgi:predicted metal-dependent hydrolase